MKHINNDPNIVSQIPHSPVSTWIHYPETNPDHNPQGERIERTILPMIKGITYYHEPTMLRFYDHDGILSGIRIIPIFAEKVKDYKPRSLKTALKHFYSIVGELTATGFTPARPYGPTWKMIKSGQLTPQSYSQKEKILQWIDQENELKAKANQ